MGRPRTEGLGKEDEFDRQLREFEDDERQIIARIQRIRSSSQLDAGATPLIAASACAADISCQSPPHFDLTTWASFINPTALSVEHHDQAAAVPGSKRSQSSTGYQATPMVRSPPPKRQRTLSHPAPPSMPMAQFTPIRPTRSECGGGSVDGAPSATLSSTIATSSGSFTRVEQCPPPSDRHDHFQRRASDLVILSETVVPDIGENIYTFLARRGEPFSAGASATFQPLMPPMPPTSPMRLMSAIPLMLPMRLMSPMQSWPQLSSSGQVSPSVPLAPSTCPPTASSPSAAEGNAPRVNSHVPILSRAHSLPDSGCASSSGIRSSSINGVEMARLGSKHLSQMAGWQLPPTTHSFSDFARVGSTPFHPIILAEDPQLGMVPCSRPSESASSHQMETSLSAGSYRSGGSSGPGLDRRVAEATQRHIQNSMVAIRPKPEQELRPQPVAKPRSTSTPLPSSSSSSSSSSSDSPHLASVARMGKKTKPQSGKAPYQRIKHPRRFCRLCSEYPTGFRGEHELRRHWTAKHSGQAKRFVCRDPASAGIATKVQVVRPLDKCKFCVSGKQYSAYYNAAAHLRRAHFRPKTGKDDRSADADVSKNGVGGRDWPSMPDIRPWFVEITIDLSGEHAGTTAATAAIGNDDDDEGAASGGKGVIEHTVGSNIGMDQALLTSTSASTSSGDPAISTTDGLDMTVSIDGDDDAPATNATDGLDMTLLIGGDDPTIGLTDALDMTMSIYDDNHDPAISAINNLDTTVSIDDYGDGLTLSTTNGLDMAMLADGNGGDFGMSISDLDMMLVLQEYNATVADGPDPVDFSMTDSSTMPTGVDLADGDEPGI